LAERCESLHCDEWAFFTPQAAVPTLELTDAPQPRMHFVDALRSVAAAVIAWHHFAWYGPLSEYALPAIGGGVCWLANYGRVAVQVFIVDVGYVLA
jgi:peptidoglycan/LPS O-acetylase OafA/YrhL